MKFEIGFSILLGTILALALGPTEFNLLAPGDHINKINTSTHLQDFDQNFQDFEELMASLMKNRKLLLNRAHKYNKNPALKKALIEKQESENQSECKS